MLKQSIALYLATLCAWGLSAAPALAKPCKCENFDALKSELAHAMRMCDAFAAKASSLRKTYGVKPNRADDQQAAKEFEAFKEGLKTIPASESGTGKPERRESTTFVPLGQKLEELNVRPRDGERGIGDGIKAGPDGYTRVPDPEARKKIEDDWKKANPGRDLCEPENGKAFYEQLKKGAACDGISAAYLAHEMTHMKTCQTMRYFAFRDRTTAEVADDEVRGYDAEIKVLAAEIQKVLADKKTRVTKKPSGACPQCYLTAAVQCGAYRVKGQDGALVMDEIVCDFEKPFTLRTTGESKLVYSMTPAGQGRGTYTYTGSCCDGAGLFSGRGNYTIRLKDDGTGTFTTSDTQATASVPGVGSHDKDIEVTTYGVTPAECPEKQGALERDLRGLADKSEPGVCRVIEPRACGKG